MVAHVLVVANGPPARGGIPTFVQLLLRSELAVRHELEFLNLSATDEGGRVRRVSIHNIRRTLDHARQVWARARGGDVVHIHTSLGPLVTTARAGLLALAARLRGGHVLLHAHGGYLELVATNRTRRLCLRVLLAPVDHVIAVAETTQRVLAAALPRTAVTRIDNGIDIARFASGTMVRASPPQVTYAGFVTPRKGLLELIEASERLDASGIEHQLVVIGAAAEDEAQSELEVRAAAHPGVRFVGAIAAEDMPAAYARSAVYCLPSWWEAMPMSVLEAMASGLPVVATRVGDVSRLVIDGETGLVVEPRDVDALTAALARLLTDEGLRTRMGDAGAARAAAHFDISRTVDEIDAVVGDLARSSRRLRRTDARRAPTTG